MNNNGKHPEAWSYLFLLWLRFQIAIGIRCVRKVYWFDYNSDEFQMPVEILNRNVYVYFHGKYLQQIYILFYCRLFWSLSLLLVISFRSHAALSLFIQVVFKKSENKIKRSSMLVNENYIMLPHFGKLFLAMH